MDKLSQRTRLLSFGGNRIAACWRRAWPVVRQVLGWFFIVLGLLGMVLPVLQGVLFLMIGIALVGRRNVVIRWASVRFKQFVRRWAALDMLLIGWLGRLMLRAQCETSRRRRQLHWWHVERRARQMNRKLVRSYDCDPAHE
jgi:hypothetical protein